MSLPDIDYFLGYTAALTKIHSKFKQEHDDTAAEDPNFAFYSKYAMSLIEEELNKLDIERDE